MNSKTIPLEHYLELVRQRAINSLLLSALKELVNSFDKSVITTDPMLVYARAAIAKAEGREL